MNCTLTLPPGLSPFARPLAILASIGAVLVLLCLGLWPFHAPSNAVAWLANSDGVRFGDYGTIMSVGTIDAPPSTEPSCSIEIWLQAARVNNEGTILQFYAPNQPARFSLHQSDADLTLESGMGKRPLQSQGIRIYLDDALRHTPLLLVTVTSGPQGTSAYLNGSLRKIAPQFRLAPNDCSGRLIVGDSALQQDTWQGDVRGVAVYSTELSTSAVLRHYQAWIQSGTPQPAPNERPAALYLFDEHSGSIVHNRAGSAPDLTIPATYTVLDQIFLEPFWQEFNFSWGYWKNAIKNVVGFVPLGFVFYAYFSLLGRTRRATLIVVLIGFAVSLTIEVTQAFLPTRDSGTTDLITNTFGTWIGVLAFRALKLPPPLRSWLGIAP